MCCPLTLATFAWFISMLFPMSSGLAGPTEASEGTYSHRTLYLTTPTEVHNKASYSSQMPPFVIAPIPDQDLTTTSDPLVFPLYDVFSSDENSRLQFRVIVNNENVVSGEIQNDTLFVSPGRSGSTRVRVFAEDSEDRQATDVFRVNVRENNPPQVTQDSPVRDQTIIQGTAPLTLNLQSIFDDPDGDPLSFIVTSSEEGISLPRIERDILVAPGDAPGKTLIEITAIDPFGSTNTVQFELVVVRPYPQQIEAGFSVSFGSIGASSSYRLVALPGDLNLDIEEATGGTGNQDWIAYAQDTNSENLIPYSEANSIQLSPGTGIWFLSKRAWELSSQAIPTVPLSPGGTYSVPLHQGWNIISNPFDIDLDWEDVSNWNGISQTLWAWDGSYEESELFESTIHEGRAYYYFNAEDRSSLELPYPGLANPFFSKRSNTEPKEAITLTAQYENTYTSTLILGRSDNAHPGLDPMDHVAPPDYFSVVNLVSASTESSTGPLHLARNIQPMLQGLYRYNLFLDVAHQQPIKLQIDQLELFEAESVTLINLLDATTYDLHDRKAIWITPTRDRTPFALLIGPESQVQETIEKIDPLLHSLKQNYPNPIQSSTTIEFSLPDPQRATLSIYDAMGRLVKVLIDQQLEAGLHRVEWHGEGHSVQRVANGIYFYRLKTDSEMIHKKMVLQR